MKLLPDSFLLTFILLISSHLSRSSVAMLTTDRFDATSQRVMDRLSFGKLGFVYVEEYFSDMLQRAFPNRRGTTNVIFSTLRDTVTQIHTLKTSRYPCQSLNILSMEMPYLEMYTERISRNSSLNCIPNLDYVEIFHTAMVSLLLYPGVPYSTVIKI